MTKLRLFLLCAATLLSGGANCEETSSQPTPPADPAPAATGAAPKTGLDVNDVSVLFPRPRDEGELALLLGADAKLEGGAELWPQATFESLLDAAGAPPPGPAIGFLGSDARNRARWRAVSFRFDPCAQAKQDGPCLVQIRLVLQPFASGARDEDVTAHLIYTFVAPDDDKRLAARLLEIKSPDTTGRPLGVHPAMAKQGLGGEVAKSYTTFLVAELSKARLGSAAIMGLENAPEPWVFAAGLVGPDGKFGPLRLDFGSGPRETSQKVGFRVPTGRVAPRMPPAHASTADLVDGDPRPMSDADARVLALVDSPVHSALLPGSQREERNRDCVSCHTTTSSLFKLSQQGNSAADVDRWLAHAERFVTPQGITGYPDPAALLPQPWSVRNFGYFSTRPALSIRTVNETAAAAQTANTLLGASNPSKRSCDDRPLWGCILENAGRDGASCFSTHCREVAQ